MIITAHFHPQSPHLRPFHMNKAIKILCVWPNCYLDFFDYYSHFDFHRCIVNIAEVGISLKTACKYNSRGVMANESSFESKQLGEIKMTPNDDWMKTSSFQPSSTVPMHFPSLVVQDPFDENNNVAKNVNYIKLQIIQQEITRAKHMFVTKKPWVSIC